MAKKDEPENTEEYTYTEDQPVEAYPLKSPSLMARTINFISTKMSQHKGLITAIGIFLVLYIFFKILNLIEHKDPNKMFKPIKPVTTLNENHVTPKFTPKLLPQLPVVNSRNTSPPTQSQNNLDGLDQKLQSVQQSLGNIDSSMQRVESILMQQLKMQQEKEQERLQAKQRKAGAFYHVQSIIPNRAWLITARGQTLTVTTGTYIPGAGIVTAIDSVNGKVITNSGIVIQFSLSDQ